MSQEASTPPQQSDESRQMNQCPPRDAICHIELNIHNVQNIYLWALISSDRLLAAGGSWNPGTNMVVQEGVVLT